MSDDRTIIENYGTIDIETRHRPSPKKEILGNVTLGVEDDVNGKISIRMRSSYLENTNVEIGLGISYENFENESMLRSKDENEGANMPILLKGGIQDRNSVTCPHCGQSLKKKTYLRKHILSVHDKVRPYQCSECELSFSRNSNLTRHVQSIHSELKPFKCSYCEYSCKRKNHLIMHVQGIHEKEKAKQYHCPQCTYQTIRKYDMIHHIQAIHEKIKPFKCSYCEFSSGWKENLMKHIEAIHDDVHTYLYPICTQETEDDEREDKLSS